MLSYTCILFLPTVNFPAMDPNYACVLYLSAYYIHIFTVVFRY